MIEVKNKNGTVQLYPEDEPADTPNLESPRCWKERQSSIWYSKQNQEKRLSVR